MDKFKDFEAIPSQRGEEKRPAYEELHSMDKFKEDLAPPECNSSESSIDYEAIPALRVGEKRIIKISTYEELHSYIVELMRVLEEVFELGIMKGTAKRYKMEEPET